MVSVYKAVWGLHFEKVTAFYLQFFLYNVFLQLLKLPLALVDSGFICFYLNFILNSSLDGPVLLKD